jgi:hypothetical protein
MSPLGSARSPCAQILERSKTVDEAVQEFRKLEDQPKPINGGYDVVSGEAEMLRWLQEGWVLVRELNVDKFLMRTAPSRHPDA